MVAGPAKPISVRATPFLMGASTVVRPSLSNLVNVTIVPSGTEFPRQSRTGSVCSTTRSPLCSADACSLQGSAATCCTTLRSDSCPRDALICTAPSLGPEFRRVHATPLRVIWGEEETAVSLAIARKVTPSGCNARLLKRSITTATALMASRSLTGTREGCTQKYKLCSAVRSHVKICGGAFLSVASYGLVSSSGRDLAGADLDGISCLKPTFCHVPRPDQVKRSRTGAAAGYCECFSGADVGGYVERERRFCLGHGQER